MLSLEPKELSIPDRHHYLQCVIGPRPIAFASTVDEEGVPNLAPFSFFNMFSSNPPILIFSPARSGRTNTTKDTYENVKKVPEVVINIVDYKMVQQTSLCSSPYPHGINEFIKGGFTPIPSEKIKPFRVKESPAQLECKVLEVKELGTEGAAGNLIICEVVKIHISEDVLDEAGKVDQQKIDLVARMGFDWYVRTDKNSMFEVEKPIVRIGMGMDNLPNDILSSRFFDNNDLGKLASAEAMPNETDVNEYKLLELADIFISLEDEPAKLEEELHRIAKQHLDRNEITVAWKTLLTFNNQ